MQSNTFPRSSSSSPCESQNRLSRIDTIVSSWIPTTTRRQSRTSSLPEDSRRPVTGELGPTSFPGLSTLDFNVEPSSPDDGGTFRRSLQIDMKSLVGDAVGNVSCLTNIQPAGILFPALHAFIRGRCWSVATVFGTCSQCDSVRNILQPTIREVTYWPSPEFCILFKCKAWHHSYQMLPCIS
jgi:hypothetical protein